MGLIVNKIQFIHSEQPPIDRGWSPTDAKLVLARLGIEATHVKVETYDHLYDLLARQDRETLYWPVCYTIGPHLGNKLVVKVLEEHGAPFLGPASRTMATNSKLVLKERLRGTLFATPSYEILRQDRLNELRISPPCIIKTEFTCNSEGVARADSKSDVRKIFEDFSRRYGQRVFAESWERELEYTAAYLSTASGPLVAVLEMGTVGDHSFLDVLAKSDNRLLKFDVPSPNIQRHVEEFTLGLARACGLDGHFRLDILENEVGTLFAIDLNGFPQMNSATSYFPMAFRMTKGLEFDVLICHILSYAQSRFDFRFPISIAKGIADAIGRTP